MKKEKINNLVLSALFLALCMVLPLLTGQIPKIGSMLLPMHIPVLLCGLICGKEYGLIVGFVAPLMRSLIFGMPPVYPTATAMAFELATYGFVVGLVFSHAKWKCIKHLYIALISALVSGRVVWGIAQVILLGLGGKGFTFAAFIAGAFLNAIPGIILQLTLIPSIMLMIKKTHFRKKKKR